MPSLALKPTIFDNGLQIPDDPVARSRLGVAALEGIEPDFESAVRGAGQSSTIEDVYGALQTQGIDALIDRLAAGGMSRTAAREGLTQIQKLVRDAGSYRLLPSNSTDQFYVTELGDILTHPNQAPPTDPPEKIQNLHKLALELVADDARPLGELPSSTRDHLLTAIGNLKDEVLTVQRPGVTEKKTSTPGMTIPDDGDWVSNTIDIDASGRLEDVNVTVDIDHTWRGDLRVELVAPDRSAIMLHNREGRSADDIKRTYTIDDSGLRALEGKEVNGRWRLRIIDEARQDTGTLNEWSLEVKTRGSTGSAQQYGETAKKKLYAGAGAITRRLAETGSDAARERAFAMAADLVKTSPYHDVRSLLVAGLNNGKDNLTAANRATFENELRPLVAPETPDYDKIFEITYDANGRPVAGNDTLRFVCMYGSEEDDLIYEGGVRMIERDGFREEQSDKAGYRMFVKDVNQGDPNAVCKKIVTYVTHMNGRNMMQAMGDPDIHVIQYDGHSNLGRNIENSLRNAPDVQGTKILSIGACATTDRAFMIRNRYPDPQQVQMINTYESTYFNWREENGRKVMSYSENMMLMFGMQKAMADLKPWEGQDSINEVLDNATDSWSHSKDINYTNPGKLEQLMLWDLDNNGVPDGGQSVWDGGRVKPDEAVQAEFQPREPRVPVDQLDGTKPFLGTQSLDTFGRYNPITRAVYNVRTIRSKGYVDMGRDGPMVSVTRDPVTRGWSVAVNSWFSHASVEAIRAETHHAFISAAIKESRSWQVRRMDDAEKNVMKLLFTAASLEYDNGWRDDRVFEALMARHGYPADQIDFHHLAEVLHVEHTRRPHELCGQARNIPEVKERIGQAAYDLLDDPNVGV